MQLPAPGSPAAVPLRTIRSGLGNFGLSTNDDLNSNTSMSEHGDQSIDAESIDLPTDEITHSRLGHSEQICRFGLCESTSLDQLAELDHQVGPHLEILSFLARE